MNGGVSSSESFDLSGGETRNVVERPCVLTGVLANENTGTDPALIHVAGTDGQATVLRIRLAPGEMWGLAGLRVACPWGLAVVAAAGEIGITVLWE